jgi:aromatic-L-amino-acid decarboxylase
MVNYIADYIENIEQRQVLSTVEPGYLRPMLPRQAPETGESFEQIMADVERVIMPGVSPSLMAVQSL